MCYFLKQLEIVGPFKEAVLINIVGEIKPEKIATLGEKLHIEPLKKAAEAIQKNK